MKNFIMSEMFDGILLATIISVVSFKLKFLTKSGAVGTFILAVIIYSVGAWKTTFPILAFFILSSILSKIGKKQKSEAQSVFEKTGQRDIIQVFANGGIIGAVVIAIVGNYFQQLLNIEIIGIVISGFIASLVDSILGATIQSQYRCSICNKITERKIHCENNTTLISGIPFINNDIVNILCAVAGVVVSIIYFSF